MIVEAKLNLALTDTRQLVHKKMVMKQRNLIGCSCGLIFILFITFSSCWLNLNFTRHSSDSFPRPSEKDPNIQHSDYLNYSNSTPTNWYDGITVKEWNTFIKGKKFIYYDRLESLGGRRLEHVKNFVEVKEIKKLCLNTVGCIGFNTQGLLKTTLSPFDDWTRLKHKGGLYVLDVDYCNFTKYEHECPLDSYCMSISNGRYRCELKEVVDNIHVVISVDEKEYKGLLPLLHSLKKHHTKNLHIHVVNTAQKNATLIEKSIFCGIKPSEDFKIYTVRFTVPEHIMSLVKGLEKSAHYLKSTANYARFYFDQIFPNLTKIIYLDVDTIVAHDVWELWKEVVSTDRLLVEIPRKYRKLSSSLRLKIKVQYQRRYHKIINLNDASFNAGVFGLNLKKWRDKKLIDEVLYWMEANIKYHFWKLGTQPLMYVVSYKDWKHVSYRWNVERLGEKREKTHLSDAYILHWSGPFKPWLRNGTYVDLWDEYDYGLCSNGNGKCLTEEEGVGGVCQCRSGFEGDFCEQKVDS